MYRILYKYVFLRNNVIVDNKISTHPSICEEYHNKYCSDCKVKIYTTTINIKDVDWELDS